MLNRTENYEEQLERRQEVWQKENLQTLLIL